MDLEFTKAKKYIWFPRLSNEILKYYPKYTVFISVRHITNFEIVYCPEHKAYEFIPAFHYKYDLSPWYQAKKHPRFSLLAIFKKYEKSVYAVYYRQQLLKELLKKIDNEKELEEIIRKRYILRNGIQRYVREVENPTEQDFLEVRNLRELEILLKKADLNLFISFLEKRKWLKAKDERYLFFYFTSPYYQNYGAREFPVYLIVDTKDRCIVDAYFDDSCHSILYAIRKKNMTLSELLKMQEELDEELWDSFCKGNYRVLKYYKNELTFYDIFAESNHEIRRRFLAKINVDELISRLVKIDSNERGELYGFDREINLLRVVCPSTKTNYFLQVPANCKTVDSAFNWTFNFNENDEVQVLKET